MELRIWYDDKDVEISQDEYFAKKPSEDRTIYSEHTHFFTKQKVFEFSGEMSHMEKIGFLTLALQDLMNKKE